MKKLLTILAIAMFVIITGCKKDKFVENVGVCPKVVSTNPANYSTGVPLNQIITISFNEKMNPVTITQGSVTLVGGAKTLGSITYDETNATISFVPTVPLSINTTYIGRISSSVKDLSGNALQTDYVWTFSTGTTLSPMVISTDPANNSTDVFLNKIVAATFSIPMDSSTINTSTFTIKQGVTQITGSVSYIDTTAFFAPSNSFTPNTVYTCTITNGVKNALGTSMAIDYVWTFTTGSTNAPYVVSTDPEKNTTGIELNKIITATFSEPMDQITISTATFTLKQGTTPVAGTVSYTGTTATFIVTGGLLSGTIYTATITSGAKNLAGIPLANNYVWNFSTKAPLGPNHPNLGTVARFGIIAGVGVSNNAGLSEIRNMDVGICPGLRSSITGFPPAIIVNGAIYASDDIFPSGIAAMLIQAKQDLTNVYLFAEAATFPAPITVAGDIGGTTLTPGIYKSTSTLLIQSGDLTLDAQGDVNAVWIFQIASDFTTVGGAGGNIILSGGAQAKNIFWQTGSSATIGDYTSFKGNILALTSITMNSGAIAEGRMLARNGAVVLTNTNIINKP